MNMTSYTKIKRATEAAIYLAVFILTWGDERGVSGLAMAAVTTGFIVWNTRRIEKKTQPDERQIQAALLSESLASGVMIFTAMVIMARQKWATGRVDPTLSVVLVAYLLPMLTFNWLFGAVPQAADESDTAHKTKIALGLGFFYVLGAAGVYAYLTK